MKTSAGKENMTPLGYAAAKGHYEAVKLLVHILGQQFSHHIRFLFEITLYV